MFKKRLSAFLVIAMTLLVLVPTVFANGLTTIERGKVGKPDITESDRYRNNNDKILDKQPVKKNPFNALRSKKKLTEESVNLVRLELSNNLISMTEEREIEVVAYFQSKPNLENLQWTFGGKPFGDWKKWDNTKGEYIGDTFITFSENPTLEGNTVKARIKVDLVYGMVNLSGRPFRTLYPSLIGTYDLAVMDTITGINAEKPMKLNVYDSYKTYDELKPALDEIFKSAKSDRYLDYQVIGKSVEGRDLHFVVLAKDKASVNKYLNQTVPMMIDNPQALQKMIANKTIGDYKIPIFINNIHPDEAPGIDAQLDALKLFTSQDKIEYKTTNNEGKEIPVTLNVPELLNHVIFLMNLTENPDGRYYNTRSNVNGFDVNRDNGYQTQVESRIVVEQIAKWNPISFLDLHGFVSDFLIEPCTPPHDPNYEYDLLIGDMLEQANEMGKAGISNTKYDHYIIPYKDYGAGWDDGTPAYTATYAMHHGALGHTIEMPELNQDSNNALMYTILASGKFIMENKDRLFKNQLEYFRRGIEGIDDRAVDEWLVNAKEVSIGRPRENNQNFFPEYYVLPINKELQKNPLEVYNIVEYLLRNGVKVEKTVKEVKVGTTTYSSGTYIVNMHQAKRGYANTVLYKGYDASDFEDMYAEIVMNFPALRGFDKYEVRTAGAFSNKTEQIKKVDKPFTQVTGSSEQYIVRNTNNDVIRAVNRLLSDGKNVSMALEAGDGYTIGDYVVSKNDLQNIRKDYLLEVLPLNKNAKTKALVQPKIAVTGTSHVKFVMIELGFNIVSLDECDLILDDSGLATNKASVLSGKDYIGVGRLGLRFAKNNLQLSGFDYVTTNSYHEGLLMGEFADDNIITSGYKNDTFLYTANGSWISKISQEAKVLAKISNDNNFYIAGWWPGNDGAKGQVMAITQEFGNSKITLFANTITNKAHPQKDFRLLANSIFASSSNIE